MTSAMTGHVTLAPNGSGPLSFLWQSVDPERVVRSRGERRQEAAPHRES